MHRGERIIAGSIAGLIAGFAVLGIGGRVSMRLIAMAEGQPLTLTVRGTLGVLVAFSIIGMILSVPFATLQGYMRSSNLRKGATFGLFLMLLIVWAMPLVPLIADGGMDPLNFASIVARTLFSALFLVYGVVVASVSERLNSFDQSSER
jgi:hypothetical protein